VNTHINKESPSFWFCDIEDATISGEIGERDVEHFLFIVVFVRPQTWVGSLSYFGVYERQSVWWDLRRGTGEGYIYVHRLSTRMICLQARLQVICVVVIPKPRRQKKTRSVALEFWEREHERLRHPLSTETWSYAKSWEEDRDIC